MWPSGWFDPPVVGRRSVPTPRYAVHSVGPQRRDPIMRRRYRRRADATVVAIQLELDTSGFTYRKWGAEQTCKRGDWLVRNRDETYTVDARQFAETYEAVTPGVYRKVKPVWAEEALSGGSIETREGQTHYSAGHMLVFHDSSGSEGYAMDPDTFRELYELDG